MRNYFKFLLFGLACFGFGVFLLPSGTFAATATFYSTASDGYLRNRNSSYQVAHDASSASEKYATGGNLNIGQIYSEGQYIIDRSFIYFDTSSIGSGENILSATLSLYGTFDVSLTDFDITIQNGQPTYPHNPLEDGDYKKGFYSGDGGNLSTSGFTSSGYNNITLNATGLGWINKTGLTKFAIRSSRDISENTPTGYEFVQVASNEAGGDSRPKLTVTYGNTLTVSKTGTGSGTVTSNPAGINCGSTCLYPYDSGTVVNLSAAPGPGSTFTGWSGACSGTGVCTLTMNSNKSATANFNSAYNVSGWAWSKMDDASTPTIDEGQIGWISFNSSNCDTDKDGFSNGAVGCPLAGTPMAAYGVGINSNGSFAGYAWSESIGWIDFAPLGPYPASPNYSACLDFIGAGQACDGIGNYNAGGWARALSYGGGWDGWIKLRGANYGVSVNSGTGDFSGYGWSDAVLGWIKFAGANYKVKTTLSFNNPPDKPTEASPTTWDNCVFLNKSTPTFHWTYSDPEGDPQASYEIEVDDNANFNDPKFNHIVDNAAASYSLDLTQDDDDPEDLPPSMQDYQLDWGEVTYNWRVRVKDDHNNWSAWSNPELFKTPEEAYPYPGVSWDPPNPNQKEVVVFTPDQIGSDAYLWTVNEDTGTGYQFVDGTDILSQEPHIKFLTAANTVKLQVTRDSYTCESQEYEITANLPLPEYKETAPIIWLKKMLAGLYNSIFF